MEIVHFKNCCCGVFSLRTGSLIILWINLIVGLLLALLPATYNSIADINRPAINATIETSVDSNGNLYKRGTTTPAPEQSVEEWSKEYSLNPRAVEAIKMWSPPAGWVITFTSISALYGVSTSRPLLILPFILSSSLIICLLAVVEVAVSSRQFVFCTVGYMILHSEIFIYFILVLFSHYRIIAGYTQDV